MLRKIEKNAKSKEEALKLAAEELGVSVDELSYKVEREVGKGLVGLLLGKEVVISAWITKEAEEEERLQKLAEERAQPQKTESGETPYAPKQEPEFKDHVGPEGRKKKRGSKSPINEEAAPVPEAQKPAVPEPTPAKRHERKRGEVTEKSLEDAKEFATALIHKIGLSDAEVKVENGGDEILVDVSGPRMGLLIGKRGDTLDAIQYLTSLYVNKEKNSYIKVTMDTENYRAKREETLVKLAKSLERRVIREQKAQTLEPMNPNERRIIHAALQSSTRVTTYSTGEEPNRKIVVTLAENK